MKKKSILQLFIFAVIVILLNTIIYANTNAASVRVWSFNMEGWNHQAAIKNVNKSVHDFIPAPTRLTDRIRT